jgi:hypothetical protein
MGSGLEKEKVLENMPEVYYLLVMVIYLPI